MSAKPADPDYAAGVKAINAGQFAAAIPLLQKATARDGTNADAYNWLAYAMRRNGDPAGSIPVYQKALALDPKHRGAHEYIGEAYLTLDNLPKAKEHLGRLDKLCFFPCSQYKDLKKAVEAYESSGGRSSRPRLTDRGSRPALTNPLACSAVGALAGCRSGTQGRLVPGADPQGRRW